MANQLVVIAMDTTPKAAVYALKFAGTSIKAITAKIAMIQLKCINSTMKQNLFMPAKLQKNKDYCSKNDCFIGFGFLSCRILDFYPATFCCFKSCNSNWISLEVLFIKDEIGRFQNNFSKA